MIRRGTRDDHRTRRIGALMAATALVSTLGLGGLAVTAGAAGASTKPAVIELAKHHKKPVHKPKKKSHKSSSTSSGGSVAY